MSRSIVRSVALNAIVVLVLGAGAGAQDAPKPQGKMKDLLEERAAVTRDAARLTRERFKSGQGSVEDLLQPMRLELEAALDLCETPKQRVTVLEKFLAVARDHEGMLKKMVDSGQLAQASMLVAKAERLRVEIALERAKVQTPAKPGNARQDLQDKLELAEKHAAIKRAAVKVVEAQRTRVLANFGAVKSHLALAKTEESFAELSFKRIQELAKAGAVDAVLLDEHRAKLDAAKARRGAAEAAIAEGESLVTIEDARIAQARLELEEAELRVKHLKARLD